MINDIQEKLKEIGVEIIDNNTGEFRSFEDVMTSIAKSFQDIKDKNKTETNKDTIKDRENTIDDICLSLVGGVGMRDSIKNKNKLKALLLKL